MTLRAEARGRVPGRPPQGAGHRKTCGIEKKIVSFNGSLASRKKAGEKASLVRRNFAGTAPNVQASWLELRRRPRARSLRSPG
jgi:hypothetical protein